MTNPKMGEFCWNELATPDVEAAKDFYGKMFGWEFIEHKTDDMTYTMIKGNDKEFAGMWEVPANQAGSIPPHWMSYILVDDLGKTVEKAKDLGATIKIPVTKAGDYGFFAILIDPTGAHIAFWQSTNT